MKILDIKNEPNFNRGYVEFELEGQNFVVVFQYDIHIPKNNNMNNPLGSFYSGPNLQAQNNPLSSDHHFYETAKYEVARFLSSRLFKEWDLLKGLKK